LFIGLVLFITAFGGCRQPEISAEPQEPENISGIQREVFNAEKYPALLSVGN
jgi:hypothetical protein